MGLNLSKYKSGMHYIFCEGTGELPFLDLLDFIYKKLMFTTFHKTYPEEAQKLINPFDSGFQMSLENNIQFKFFLDIEYIEDSLSVCLIQDILNFQETYKTNKLIESATVRITKASKTEPPALKKIKFVNQPFFADHIGPQMLKDEPQGILVCGSANFNSLMKIEACKVSKEYSQKIFYV